MERERRTLAAEVHDGLAQYLAVARRELALPEPDRERLIEAVEPPTGSSARGCRRFDRDAGRLRAGDRGRRPARARRP